MPTDSPKLLLARRVALTFLALLMFSGAPSRAGRFARLDHLKLKSTF